jgi:hypothetical protein
MAARHPRYSVDKCAIRLCFFLAAGTITFLPAHKQIFPQLSPVWDREFTFAKIFSFALLSYYHMVEE